MKVSHRSNFPSGRFTTVDIIMAWIGQKFYFWHFLHGNQNLNVLTVFTSLIQIASQEDYMGSLIKKCQLNVNSLMICMSIAKNEKNEKLTASKSYPLT